MFSGNVADLLCRQAIQHLGAEQVRLHSLAGWSPRKWLVLVWLDRDSGLEPVDGIGPQLRGYHEAGRSWDPLERALATQIGGGPWPNRLTANLTLQRANGAGLAHLDTSGHLPRAVITPTGRTVVTEARLKLRAAGEL